MPGPPKTSPIRMSRGSTGGSDILLPVSSSDGGSLLGGGSTFTEEIMSTFTGNDDSTALIENLRRSETATTIGTRTSSGFSSYGMRRGTRGRSEESIHRKVADLDEDVLLSRQWQAQRDYDKPLPDFSSATIVLSKDVKSDQSLSPENTSKKSPKSPTTGKPPTSPATNKAQKSSAVKLQGSPSRIRVGQQRLESVMEAGSAVDETGGADSPATALSLTSSGSNEGMKAHENGAAANESSNVVQARAREETDEIVREVQRRLNCLNGRGGATGKKEPTTSENWEPQKEEDEEVLGVKGKKYVPVLEESEKKRNLEGEGLAAKHDMSDDEESQASKKKGWVRSKKCILFVILLILFAILAVLILFFLRGLGSKESNGTQDISLNLSSPSPSPAIRTRQPTISKTMSPSLVRGTKSPVSILETSSPTIASRETASPSVLRDTEVPVLGLATAAPTLATESPTTKLVTASPTSATKTPTANPTAAPSPGRVPTQQPVVPTLAPTNRPTPAPVVTLAPVVPALDIVRNMLLDLSGDALFDRSSPQFAALDWLVKPDSSDKDILTLPSGVVRERYVVALLHTALRGNQWADQYGFLSSNSVCDWNSESSALGVFCDDDGKVNEIAMSK